MSLTRWRGDSPWDNLDFEVDLGCGKLKKGRIGVDRWESPDVNFLMELDDPDVMLPWMDSSVASIISHHFFEHIGTGFIPLVDEIYRVLKPGGILRAITPLFPSRSAVEDPDHKRYFMEGTWETFCGFPGDGPQQHWHASFSVPYTKARFEMVEKICTPPVEPGLEWGQDDVREIRVALRARK